MVYGVFAKAHDEISGYLHLGTPHNKKDEYHLQVKLAPKKMNLSQLVFMRT